MKKIFYSAILFPFLFGNSYAQTTVWTKKYGGFHQETVESMIKTSDGGIVMVGYTESTGNDFTSDPMSGVGDAFMIKTDSDGNLLWAKTFGGSERDYAYKVIENVSGDYVMVGSSGSNDGDLSGTTYHGGLDMFIAAYHPDGTITWKNQIGGSNDETAFSLIEITGGYAIVGETLSNDGDISGNHLEDPGSPFSTTKDYFLIKTNVLGIPVWQKCYGGNLDESGNIGPGGIDVAKDIAVLSDGTLAIVGYTNSVDGDITEILGGRDIWLVKVSQFNGDIISSNSIGGTGWDEPETLLSLPGNELIVMGYTQSNDGDVSGNHGFAARDIWIAKLDVSMSVSTQRCFGGSGFETSYGIVQTSDGGFVVSGTSASSTGDVSGNYGSWDWWIFKTNPDFTIQWEKSYGSTTSEVAKDIIELSPNSYLITGVSGFNGGDFPSPYGLDDCWLLKISTSATNEIGENNTQEFKLFPNPANDFFLIETETENSLVEIYDPFGRKVMDVNFKNSTKIDCSTFESGIYFIHILVNEKRFVQSLMIH